MSRQMLIRVSRIAAIFFFSSALVAAGLWMWYRQKTVSFLEKAATTDGTVVKLREESGGTFHLVVEFNDALGGRHRVVSPWASSPPEASVGDKVRVYYDSRNPNEARIGETGIRFASIICIAFVAGGIGGGILLLLIPVVCFRVRPIDQP